VALVKIWKILRKEKVDIVHTHSSKAGILGRWAAYFAGVACRIHTFHGFGFNDYQAGIVRNAFIWAERLTAPVTSMFVAVSHENMRKALGNGIGRKEKYAVIRAGVKIKDFSGLKIDIAKKKQELKIPAASPVIGMIACFKPQKAPLDFVIMAKEVARIFEDARFLLVGDGELRSNIEELRERLDLKDNLTLTGWRTDVPEIMQVIDIVVLTSLWEGLPCVFAQAMAASKPVVATDVDGAREVIEDGVNGFLLPPHRPKDMAERVVELVRDGERAKRMGRKGKEKLKSEFDIDTMVKDIEGLYENAEKR